MCGKHVRLPLLALTLATGAFKGAESLTLLQPGLRGMPSLPPLAFLKTHKTGGSTLTNIIHRLVERRHLTLVFPNDGHKLDWRTLPQTVPPQHQFDVVCNHNVFNETALRAYLKPSPFIFSIVREPVAATDSRLRWKLRRNDEVGSWASWLDHMSERRALYANPFARDLGWYGVDTRSHEPLTPPELDHNSSAIADFVESLDRTLDFVLLTEHYDEGLVLLRRRLGLSLEEVTYVRMKVNDGSAPVEPTPEERRLLQKEFLSVDVPLYEHFRSRFWREWEAAGGEAVLAGELAELRLRNAQLQQACDAKSEALCPVEFMLDNVPFTQRLRDEAQAAGRPSW